MKLLIWLIFAIAALLWTAAAALVSAAVQWGLELLGSDQKLDVNQILSMLSIPAWLTQWVDLASIRAAFEAVARVLESLQQSWPSIAGWLQWLVPATWALWFLGMLLMLTLAVISHLLVGRASASVSAVRHDQVNRPGSTESGAAKPGSLTTP